MSLIDPKKLYDAAFDKNFSVSAFNVFDLESLIAVIEGCEDENSAAFIQIAKGGEEFLGNPRLFFETVKIYASQSKVPFVLHHDHITSYEYAKETIENGFKSIMFDGSKLSLEENAATVLKIKDNYPDIFVEAELGSIPGLEDDVFGEETKHTNPNDIERFLGLSRCDSLAISVGTAHGGVLSEKHIPLNSELAEKICKRFPNVPFVLHGGASMPKELIDEVNRWGGKVPQYRICSESDIEKACEIGIKKVNMDVDNFLCYTAALRKALVENPEKYDPKFYLKKAQSAFCDEVRHKVKNVVKSADSAKYFK